MFNKYQVCKAFILVIVSMMISMNTYASTPRPAVRFGEANIISPTAAWDNHYNIGGAGSASGLAPVRSKYIKDLARSLKQDPTLIFQYVHDNIETDYTFGLKKGGVAAYLAQRGTAFDQAHLFVELLRESGFAAEYVYGTISLNAAETLSWLGTKDYNTVLEMMGNGGVPAVVTGGTNVSSLVMAHVWVRATINSSSVQFDPSFKKHEIYSGEDFSSIFSGSTANLETEISCQVASVCNEITSVNYAGLKNKLDAYSTSLLNHLKGTDYLKSTKRFLGGKDILPLTSLEVNNVLQQAMMNYTEQTSWSNHVPNIFRTTLNVKFSTINHTFFADEIADQRLWIEMKVVDQSGIVSTNDTTTATVNYVLRTDDATHGTSANFTFNPFIGKTNGVLEAYPITLGIDHPYAANNGDYLDEDVIKLVDLEKKVAIVFGLGSEPALLAGIFARYASVNYENLIPTQAASPSHVPHADDTKSIFHVMGSRWTSVMTDLLDLEAGLAKGVAQHHHSLGFIYDQMVSVNDGTALFEMVPRVMDIDSVISVANSDTSGKTQKGMAVAISSGANALEALVLRETYNFNKIASGIGYIKGALATTNVGVSKYTSISISDETTLSQRGYSQGQINQLKNYVNNGYDVLVPHNGANGNFATNEWISARGVNAFTGAGAIAIDRLDGGVANVILGPITSLKGAGGAISPYSIADFMRLEHNYINGAGGIISLFNEQTGAVEFTLPADITVGNIHPLTFIRTYSSVGGGNGALGFGWTHNHYSELIVDTDIKRALGQFRALDAIQAIVASKVVQQYFIDNDDRTDGYLLSALTHDWWAKAVEFNVVNVTLGANQETYIKLPDASYLGESTNKSVLTLLSGTIRTMLISDANLGAVSNRFSFEELSFRLRRTTGEELLFGDIRDETQGFESNYAWNPGELHEGRTGNIRLLSKTLPSGYTVTYNYNPKSRLDERAVGWKYLHSVSDNLGYSLTFDHHKDPWGGGGSSVDVEGLLSGGLKSDTPFSAGSFVGFVFYNAPSLHSVSGVSGEKVQFIYTGYPYEQYVGTPKAQQLNLLRSTIDANNNIMDYQYSGHLQRIEASLPMGHVFDTIILKEPNKSHEDYWPKLLSISKKTANTLSDPYNYTIEENYIYQSENLFQFTYDDAHSRVRSIKDILNNVTNVHVSGSRAEVINALGHSNVLNYDRFGHLLRKVDPLGRQTSFEYNERFQAIRHVRPNGLTVELEYDSGFTDFNNVWGNVTKVKQIPSTGILTDSIETLYDFEDTSWPTFLTKHTSPKGDVTNWTYDTATGFVLTETGPEITAGIRPVTQYEYTISGRLKKFIDPTGLVSENAYDAKGNLISTTVDPLGEKIKVVFFYDLVGNLCRTVGPRGSATETGGYDPACDSQ